MIHLDLLHRRSRWLRWVLLGSVGLSLCIIVAFAGLYWIDQRYPLYKAWNDLLGGGGDEEVAMKLEEEWSAAGEA